eukprot:scaffold240947_cov27-Tisochrysis_lutea.AAC.5
MVGPLGSHSIATSRAATTAHVQLENPSADRPRSDPGRRRVERDQSTRSREEADGMVGARFNNGGRARPICRACGELTDRRAQRGEDTIVARRRGRSRRVELLHGGEGWKRDPCGRQGSGTRGNRRLARGDGQKVGRWLGGGQ